MGVNSVQIERRCKAPVHQERAGLIAVWDRCVADHPLSMLAWALQVKDRMICGIASAVLLSLWVSVWHLLGRSMQYQSIKY